MAPLLEATAKRLIKSTSSTATYIGSFDDEWSIGSVPNGGYSLGIINVCAHDYLVNQLHSNHVDLFHTSSTYLNATDVKQGWTLDIQITKRGKGYTNLDANLSQKSHKTGEMTIRLQARFIYTDFSKNQSDSSTESLTVLPGSSYYPAFPCLSEPGDNLKNAFRNNQKINARNRFAVYRDNKAQENFQQRNDLSCAGYMKLFKEKVSEKDVAHFNNAAIVLFTDMTEKSMSYLPNDAGRETNNWFPTLFLSIEMKRALPSFPLVGVANLVTTRHVDHGQFEIDVELWSHPDDAEKLQLPKGVKSVILCISRQVALTIPISTQASIMAKKEQKAKL